MTEEGESGKMLFTENDVIDYIRYHLTIVPVMTIGIIRKMCENYFYPLLTDEAVDVILRKMQSYRYLLISEDGYIMTRGAYVKLTGDRFFNNLLKGYTFRVRRGLDYTQSREGTKILDCLWVYADMIPYSENLMVNKGGWDVTFTTKQHDNVPPRIYNVENFERGTESINAERLRLQEKDNKPNDIKCIRRMALFQNPDRTYLSPVGIGITSIACIDHEEESHFCVLENIPLDKAWEEP